RQFVERHARKRNIALPPGPLFADAPPAKKHGGKTAPEPPKPATPTMRPRLVKTAKPATAEHVAEPEAPAAPVPVVEEHEPVVEAVVPVPEPVIEDPAPNPVEAKPAPPPPPPPAPAPAAAVETVAPPAVEKPPV